MIVPFTLFLGALGYLYYKSKEEVTLLDRDNIDSSKIQTQEDDLYQDLEDLFI